MNGNVSFVSKNQIQKGAISRSVMSATIRENRIKYGPNIALEYAKLGETGTQINTQDTDFLSNRNDLMEIKEQISEKLEKNKKV